MFYSLSYYSNPNDAGTKGTARQIAKDVVAWMRDVQNDAFMTNLRAGLLSDAKRHKPSIKTFVDYLRELPTGSVYAGMSELTVFAKISKGIVHVCLSTNGNGQYAIQPKGEYMIWETLNFVPNGAPPAFEAYIKYNGINHFEALLDVQIIA